jgi:hypothetical protein
MLLYTYIYIIILPVVDYMVSAEFISYRNHSVRVKVRDSVPTPEPNDEAPGHTSHSIGTGADSGTDKATDTTADAESERGNRRNRRKEHESESENSPTSHSKVHSRIFAEYGARALEHAGPLQDLRGTLFRHMRPWRPSRTLHVGLYTAEALQSAELSTATADATVTAHGDLASVLPQ